MIAKMNQYSGWIPFQEEKELAEQLEEQLNQSGFHVVDKIEHYFPVQGYTGLWLLSESHFAIHSFPEENKIYFELSSCVDGPFVQMKQYLEQIQEQ